MTAKENRYIINGLMIWWNYICFHVRSDVSIRLVPIIPDYPCNITESRTFDHKCPNFRNPKAVWRTKVVQPAKNTSSKEMFRLCKFLETAIWIAPKLFLYLDVRVALKVRSLVKTWAGPWIEPQLYNLLGLYFWQNCMNISA